MRVAERGIAASVRISHRTASIVAAFLECKSLINNGRAQQEARRKPGSRRLKQALFIAPVAQASTPNTSCSQKACNAGRDGASGMTIVSLSA